MQHKFFRAHASWFHWRHLFTEEVVALFLVLLVFAAPASASTRFEDRSLTMNSAVPGAVTSYTVTFQYISPQAVGSVDMLFCQSPIPYEPCVAPAGLDVSTATLANQTGEIGFSIATQDTNHIILSRPSAGLTAATVSSYTFTGVTNPTDTSKAFAIRLRSHTSTDATGPQIDFGSVRGQVTTAITIEAQVPPMLLFCVAGEVQDNCAGTNENYFTDMGVLSPDSTLTAQSQMAVGTNASAGFVIFATGPPLSAGTSVIDGSTTPTASTLGKNQFGINLVANNEPTVGSDPEGTWANAVPASDYSQPNKYKYVPGDVVAFSPNVSLMKKFTVSYIVNTDPDLRAGVYTTTITFVASGRF